MVPTPNSYSRRICSNNSTFSPLSKPDHKGIGHSSHRPGGESVLFFQGLCDLDRLIDFAQLVLPWSILYQMPLHVGYQAPHPFAPMVPCDFVVQVAETTLDGVGAGTIGRQKQQHKARMLP